MRTDRRVTVLAEEPRLASDPIPASRGSGSDLDDIVRDSGVCARLGPRQLAVARVRDGRVEILDLER